MTERRTYRNGNGQWAINVDGTEITGPIADYLASFEEIGMTPSQMVEFTTLIKNRLKDGVLLQLPCKIGTHLWRVTTPYRQAPKVTEYVVKNIRTAGKKHSIQLEVQAVNVPGTNWMEFGRFHTTKEEAEAELRGKSK